MTDLEKTGKKTMWAKTLEFFNSPRFFEATGAFGMMSAKYFLAISSVWGWYLTIIGYVLTGIYVFKIKFLILLTVILQVVLLSFYGLYKWTNHIVGFQPIDYGIMIACSILAVFYIISEARAKRKYWINQSITVTAATFATLALALGYPLAGWGIFLVSYTNNIILFSKKKGYFFISMQVISFILAIISIVSICTGVKII